MINVWAFYRRSTDKQELSIEDQKRECWAYAMTNNWQIVREFSPSKGFGSGLSIDSDPAFVEMFRLAALKNHGAKYLLVYDVSRFGRLRPEEKIYFEQKLKRECGLQVQYVKDDFKNDGSLGDGLLRFVKHSEAHEFSKKLSENTLRGSLSHARLGHSCGGSAPYGYDRILIDSNGTTVKVMKPGDRKADKMQRVKWIPGDPSKIHVVKTIFEMFDKGIGLNKIVNKLNIDGIPSPRAHVWRKNNLWYILRNSAYMGTVTYNKKTFSKYRRKELTGFVVNPKEDWVIVENAHEAIIDKGLFERVQARLTKRKFRPGGNIYQPSYLLTSLIRCGKCGNTFVGVPKRGKGGLFYKYYCCSGYLYSGTSVCQSTSVRVEDIERFVLEKIKGDLNNPEWKKRIPTLLREAVQGQIDAQPNKDLEREKIKCQLKGIESQINNLVQFIKSGSTNFSSIQEEMIKLERQKQDLILELNKISDEKKERSSFEDSFKGVMELSAKFDDVFNSTIPIDEKKEFIRAYVNKIIVTKDESGVKADFFYFKIPGMVENEMIRRGAESVSLKLAGAPSVPNNTGLIPLHLQPFIEHISQRLKNPFRHYQIRKSIKFHARPRYKKGDSYAKTYGT